MDSDEYYDMLQAMTLEVRDKYETASNKTMGEMEARALSDLLDMFFTEMR